MSTATGISGGAYLISQSDLRGLEAQGVSAETVEQLEAAGYEITEAGLAAFAAEFGEDRAEELRDDYLGETFTARRDLERVSCAICDDAIRNTRERKAAADLFAVTILGERYPTEAAFRAALESTGIAEADHDRLTDLAYTGWRWTRRQFRAALRAAIDLALCAQQRLLRDADPGRQRGPVAVSGDLDLLPARGPREFLSARSGSCRASCRR